MAEKQCCGNCHFQKKGAKMFECHIAPPTRYLDKFKENASAWPPVLKTDWCGEWEPKAKKEVIEDPIENEQTIPLKEPDTLNSIGAVEPIEESTVPDVGVKEAVNPLTNQVNDEVATTAAQIEVEALAKEKLDAQGYVEQDNKPDPDEEDEDDEGEDVLLEESTEEPDAVA